MHDTSAQAVQHPERVGIQRHAFVDSLDPVEDQRCGFSSDTTDLRERLNGVADIASSFQEILCPGDEVLRLVTTMRNAAQVGNDCLDRRDASAVRRGKSCQELRQSAVDDRVRAVRRENNPGSHFPGRMSRAQNIQWVWQAGILGIFFDFPQFAVHFDGRPSSEDLVFRGAGHSGHIMES